MDFHKQTVVACLVRTSAEGQRTTEVRTFSTLTEGLLALADWLRATGVKSRPAGPTGGGYRR